MTILSGGNVGFGTTVPDAKVQIHHSSTNTNLANVPLSDLVLACGTRAKENKTPTRNNQLKAENRMLAEKTLEAKAAPECTESSVKGTEVLIRELRKIGNSSSVIDHGQGR